MVSKMQQIFNKISLAKFRKIISVFYIIKQKITVLHKMLWNFTKVKDISQ